MEEEIQEELNIGECYGGSSHWKGSLLYFIKKQK